MNETTLPSQNHRHDDVVLTDLEGDAIFVIHPKPKVIIIDPERIPENIPEECGPTEQFIIADPSNTSPRCWAIFVESLTNCMKDYGNFIQVHAKKFATSLSQSFDWTVVQAWYNLGYVTCLVPFRIQRDEQTGEDVLNSNIVQKLLWALQSALSLSKIVNWLPVFKEYFEETPDPFLYIRICALISSIVVRITFWKVTYFNAKHLLKLHKVELAGSEQQTVKLQSKKTTRIILVSFVTYLGIIASLDFSVQIYSYHDKWDWSPTAIMQYTSCLSQNTLLWRNEEYCSVEYTNIFELPYHEFLWGSAGIVVYIFNFLIKQNIVLSMFSCSVTLLLATSQISREMEKGAERMVENFNRLKNVAEELSRFIGPLLLTHLIDTALLIPDFLDGFFKMPNATVIVKILYLFMTFTCITIACVTSLYMEEIKEKVSDAEANQQQPSNAQQTTWILLKFFKGPVGIGYFGLFVVNFRFLIGYLGIVGSLIMVVYETTKNDSEMNWHVTTDTP